MHQESKTCPNDFVSAPPSSRITSTPSSTSAWPFSKRTTAKSENDKSHFYSLTPNARRA